MCFYIWILFFFFGKGKKQNKLQAPNQTIQSPVDLNISKALICFVVFWTETLGRC